MQTDTIEYHKKRGDALAVTVFRLKEIVTHDHESKESFIGHVTDLLNADPDKRLELLHRGSYLLLNEADSIVSDYHKWDSDSSGFIGHDDFTYDAGLTLTGDFPDLETKARFASAVAERLNAYGDMQNRIRELERQLKPD